MSVKRMGFAMALVALPALAAASTDIPDITTQTTSVGFGVPVDVSQPSLALTPIVRIGSNDAATLGEVKWFAGSFAPTGFALAHGQEFDIASNQALFSRLGTAYGGDGRTTFRLPDLRGRAVLGAGGAVQLGRLYSNSSVTLAEDNFPAHKHTTSDGITTSSFGADGTPETVNVKMPSVALNYRFNRSGLLPSRSEVLDGENTLTSTQNATSGQNALVATMYMDAGMQRSASADTLQADGTLLPIGINDTTFSLIGTLYGGDGRTDFALPDTVGKLVMGDGQGPGLFPRRLGLTYGNDAQTVAGTPRHGHSEGGEDTSEDASGVLGGEMFQVLQETLATHYIISLQGAFPSSGESTSIRSEEPFLGEVGLFAGNFAPQGWVIAEGQTLSVRENQELFSILGTAFGGDGRTTFRLPDLRGRVPIGADLFLGTRSGFETVTLTENQLPAHTHSVARPAPVPLPAGFPLLLAALGSLWIARRRAAI